METVVQIAQLLLALSILIGIHEAGHMLAAKAFGMRVEKFFIGFPPKIFGFKKGETEYGLGSIPLGGFVKISGMIDESLDKEQMAQEPQPWEFRSKPAWQRLIVMLGGIIINVIAGIVAFIILTYNTGDDYIAKEEVMEHGIMVGAVGEELGFQHGDRILAVNGDDYERLSDLIEPGVFLEADGGWTVDRNGRTFEVNFPKGFINRLEDINLRRDLFDVRMPFVVGLFGENSNIEASGVLIEDQITKVGDTEIQYFDQMKAALAPFAGGSVSIDVVRDGNPMNFQVEVNPDTTIGFYPLALNDISTKNYTFGEAVTKGTSDAFGSVVLNARALGRLFTGEISARSLSGPIGIVKLYSKKWDWNKFWRSTGFISMVLAFMNLLPIPALDGGHVVFLLYEMISGKAPSDKFLENAQKVGMVIILMLMVFVLGNDILKLFGL